MPHCEESVCRVLQCKAAVCSVLHCKHEVCSVPQCKPAVASLPQFDVAVCSVSHCNPAGCGPPHCEGAVCKALLCKAALLTATAAGSWRATVWVPVAVKLFDCPMPASLATFLFFPAVGESPISFFPGRDPSEYLVLAPLPETPNICSPAI